MKVDREIAALRAGRQRRLQQLRRYPWMVHDVRRITEEIARPERERRGLKV